MNDRGGLLDILEESRRYGFLGPGPLDAHLDSARRFLVALAPLRPGVILDLGSGGGVPALPLAVWMEDVEFVLLDSMERRTDFLLAAASRLDLAGRVTVVRERAENAGREQSLRGRFDAVTARSFGPPAVTAECGAPFLRVGGVLVVSEPPDRPDRWPADGLAQLGLENDGATEGVAVLSQREPCPVRFPRRPGIPAKRPLF